MGFVKLNHPFKETHKSFYTPKMSKTDDIGIIQFVEGNFLRCLVDGMTHRHGNEGLYQKKVALAQPIERGRVEELKSTEGRYHYILQGVNDGESVTEIETINVFEAFRDDPELLTLIKNKKVDVLLGSEKLWGTIATQIQEAVKKRILSPKT